jgi:hypothetical protein
MAPAAAIGKRQPGMTGPRAETSGTARLSLINP